MKKNFQFAFYTLLIGLFLSSSAQAGKTFVRPRIDLGGSWKFQLDNSNVGITEGWQTGNFSDSIVLPGTTDTNKKGKVNEKMNETTYLSREYSYVGRAWYSKEVVIPADWSGKEILLYLERTKPSHIFIDGVLVGTNNDVSTPQVYNLTTQLTPGTHLLTMMLDNAGQVPKQILYSGHAYSESTQTNWNGVIGDFYLEAADLCRIDKVDVYPDVANKKAIVEVSFVNNRKDLKKAKLTLTAEAWNTKKKHRLPVIKRTVDLSGEVACVDLELGNKMLLWDEFDPALYRLTTTLSADGVMDTKVVDFGMRDFKASGTQFTINGNKTFLRGKHDACVFPLTAHVAMDLDTWRHYFKVAKEYGINHYRFHSWCPPEACFVAADMEGIYLQPELPYWGGFHSADTTLLTFLEKEGVNIQKEYSNHASFVMFALGNELSGEQEVMNDLVSTFRLTDSRHIYAYGSNNYLGFRGPVDGEDYYTTCRVGREPDRSFVTHARASFSFADAYDGGYLNSSYPNSVMNFSAAVEKCPVPIISHETGQFQIYPDYNEMEKYTGVLKPRNYAVFKQRLKEAGMEGQAHDFFMASGKWSALLYRAEIEMDLRTPGFGGFQLLDLQDYPGQGSAFVGILDAFMDSKGLITPEEWREFCCEVVSLFVTDKFCWTADEALNGRIEISNFSPSSLKGKRLKWTLTDSKQTIIDAGTLPVHVEQGSLTSIGVITPKIASFTVADEVTLSLSIEGTPYKNSYSLWIYPVKKEMAVPEDILVTDEFDASTIAKLREGGKVLYFPKSDKLKETTVGGLFQTDYWNYRMFKSICENIKKPVSPGTLGILTNPDHPIFEDFPTESHTNWQWFSIVKSSYPMILNRLPSDYKPIVQVIDNIERNHKLGLIYEFAVDGGRLLVCMSDLQAVSDKPEVRQLYSSMLKYMGSDSFKPQFKLSSEDLKSLFSSKVQAGKIATLGNISEYE